ncbi:MAG: GGDEF domain-containing protein [Rhodospirillales bacterium]|nr:GGDEF domain-containing protein [Rhodospirillales bacterium]MCW8861170.1 GGDEF domain-containing protein [Rhodospirillales bacterium]MCW8952613.1 GGDEF domain-containing protein [Rhodospirillales bacterium]MCW8970969.1 GGDEF domain-containing protein [Rhodospirillales bacterium]MCW9002641.1 GGDEF domain-containing protein [Rhodospirillales bacterium]
MSQMREKLQKSVVSLDDAAGRIRSGLGTLMQLVEEIETENKGVFFRAESPDATQEEKAAISALRQLVAQIGSEVDGFASLGHQFEERLDKSTEEIKQLSDQLEVVSLEASLDPLTGIANRRQFERALQGCFDSIEDQDGRLSVLMGDVDRFKTINDTYGHRIGDHVLRLVAQVHKGKLRGNDLVSRWGGDEFAVILPETELANAMKVAENIRTALSSRVVRNKETNEALGKITMSIGVASYGPSDTPETLTHRADEALLRAKNDGRDRVVVAE